MCFIYVAKGVNFRVHNGEKIGIVGRTGAGKSSLVSAIFRMPEPNGDISIDNVSINSLNLRLSRSAVAAISQNPLLFSGTMRLNLDPEGKYDDKALWDVLTDVSLKQLVQSLPDKLESRVTEGGGNLSVGERQLLCVARALLQDKKIVVLDEATANVDMKTDRVLQDVIRSKLSGRTVLTIAHRLETILDYDKVLVMDAGKVVEFDDPKILLGRPDSEFARLYECGKNWVSLVTFALKIQHCTLHHPFFCANILNLQIAPFVSSRCLQFWKCWNIPEPKDSTVWTKPVM